jgi:hypothetical protein
MTALATIELSKELLMPHETLSRNPTTQTTDPTIALTTLGKDTDVA